MAGTELRFRSRIDYWFIALILPVVLLGPILVMLTVKHVSWRTVASVSLMPVLTVTVLLGWIVSSTWYLVSDTMLTVRSGPVLRKVPLASIRRISPSRSILSAPALSLDRLAVECNDYTSVVISPLDKAGFIRAIRERAPGGGGFLTSRSVA